MLKSFFGDLERHSDSIVFTTINERITYNQLVGELKDFSEKIEARKLAFIICENSIESIIGYLSCLRNGVVFLLIGKSIDQELLKDLIELYRPNYIWANESFAFTDEWTVTHSNRSYRLNENIAKHATVLHPDLAALFMTSGSTGSPVLVRLSYENLIQNAISISDSLSISKTDKPITTLPMNYTYGLSIINTHLLNGCEIVLTEESVMSKGFWTLVTSQEITTFGGVPYTYQMLRRLGFEKMDLPKISKLTQAGGKLEANLVKYFAEICEKKRIQFYVMYGQTEATARMSCLPAKDALTKPGSIGVPIANGSFYIVDDSSNVILESEEAGELYYKGPNVSMGYAYTLHDLQRGDENNGVLATGDLAKRDSDGYYYIVGRKKRFIKIFGNRISLDEVENILLKNGHSCVCTGIDDKLIIYSNEEHNLKELQTLIATKIAVHHSAITVKYISEFPRSDSGKILYSKLSVE